MRNAHVVAKNIWYVVERLIDVSMGNACVATKTLAAIRLIDVLMVSANVGMAILVVILVNIVSLGNACAGLHQVVKANQLANIAMQPTTRACAHQPFIRVLEPYPSALMVPA